MPKVHLTGKKSDFLKIVVATAGRGDLEAVREYVDDNPDWIHTIGSHGRTMLWEAAYRGKNKVVKFLVERGTDVTRPGCHPRRHSVEISPYCVAKYEGREEVADYLLANGAEVDIHSAAYLGDYDTVLSHLEEDPRLVDGVIPQYDPDDSLWGTPLCYAIIRYHKDIVKLLISRGSQVEVHSQRFLGYAVRGGSVDLVKLLIASGANPNKAPQVLSDSGEMVGLLKSYGIAPADLNTPSSWPPLVYACRGDKGENPEKVQKLLDLGAEVNIRDYKGKTALHRAATAGFLNVIDVLLENGADVNAADKNGETPLFDAIRSTIKDGEKKKSAVVALLWEGGSPNFENDKSVTPLRVAQRGRKKEAAEIADLLRQHAGS